MKYIFDFDDVLFNTSCNPKNFREHIYSSLEKAGVPHNLSKEYVEKERWNKFSLKKMLAHFSVNENMYKEIMGKNKSFVKNELITWIKKLGKSNCYVVSYGEAEYQIDKIERTGVSSLFSEIIVVSGSKKEAIEKICTKHKEEKVVFIDDKAKHFEDLDFKKYPNLKTILYTGQNAKSLIMNEINE
ncbi:MAG: hypothetical protein WCW93_01520 [Candidatus Paceibacterota bacterium]